MALGRRHRTFGAVLIDWDAAVTDANCQELVAQIAELATHGVHVGVLGAAALPLVSNLPPSAGRIWVTRGTGPEQRAENLRRMADLGVGAALVLVVDDAATAVHLLGEQLSRLKHRRVPDVDTDRRWTVERGGPVEQRRRVDEAVFTVCSGGVGTRGSVEEEVSGSQPMVLAAGVYRGDQCEDGLLAAPSWTEVRMTTPLLRDVRWLDLRSGVLLREEVAPTGRPVRTARFACLAVPGVGAMRVEAPTDRLAPSDVRDGTDTWSCTRTTTGDAIAMLTRQWRGIEEGFETLERISAVVTGTGGGPRRRRAESRLDAAAGYGFDVLLSTQRASWAVRWATAGVSLPDDPEVELGLRFALFHLWSLDSGAEELAVGARGLAGSGYAGHVFWDADVFVLPALMTMAPSAARGMVEYRLRRLPAARAHAAELGYRGARFPWESARTGRDVTPRSGLLGGEEVPILTGLREEHVTADVAWAALRQARWAGRDLSARELDLVAETADYWLSRVSVGPDGRAHLRGVIGPDEYHEDVDDNAFTNVLVRWHLRAAATLVTRAPRERRDAWLELADSIVDGHDPGTGRYEQFDGYSRLAPAPLIGLGRSPVAADVLVGSRRVARSQLIKQADVLMLHMMVPDEVAPGSLEPNLDHYLPRTAHGSSLSPAAHAFVLARAGRSEEARDLLATALRVDLDDQAGTTAGGLHVGAMGGAWQAFLFGFVGAQVVGDVLELDPRLPPRWRHVEVRFRCLSSDIRLWIRDDIVTLSTRVPIRARRRGGPTVDVPAGHRARTLPGGGA
ncbi:hypothetical protein QI633_12315 [Nocardioides sp. QY071]|uniref:hypothetical protein n=1 Tax=Nocardioides sp. QY071 TaxID=3044187 RepID=UPI00249B1000|nr:hypothetical protein [Nocardioides sp. QY071]WGY04525.1 hypothetical protein QI633_12315 [Nocardioides sp. QY071]